MSGIREGEPTEQYRQTHDQAWCAVQRLLAQLVMDAGARDSLAAGAIVQGALGGILSMLSVAQNIDEQEIREIWARVIDHQLPYLMEQRAFGHAPAGHA